MCLRHEKMAKKLLKVPDDKRLLAILPIGKPTAASSQTGKKPLSEILHREQYGNKTE